MQQDLFYLMALREVPSIGHIYSKKLVDYFGTAENVFKATKKQIVAADIVSAEIAGNIKRFRDFHVAEKELRFIEKYKIQCLTVADPSYPKRLNNCYDPPLLLFYRGTADLNKSRFVGIIGTRSSTDYGRVLTEKLVQALQPYEVTIVSGLAFGIDSFAHKNAIKHNIPTIGVLAHGLDIIYPPEHASLAKDMSKTGGLLTEFISKTAPDKYNFPSRNRVVAGMCDVIVVVETGIKGGSLITVDLANGYSRDVYALPGRVTDTRSLGCNRIIREHRAHMLTQPNDLPELLGWNDHKKKREQQPKELFPELNPNEQKLVDLLQLHAPMHIDDAMLQSGMTSSETASVVLGLELRSIITTLPGKRLMLV
jgi:DNA processing protein